MKKTLEELDIEMLRAQRLKDKLLQKQIYEMQTHILEQNNGI